MPMGEGQGRLGERHMVWLHMVWLQMGRDAAALSPPPPTHLCTHNAGRGPPPRPQPPPHTRTCVHTMLAAAPRPASIHSSSRNWGTWSAWVWVGGWGGRQAVYVCGM